MNKVLILITFSVYFYNVNAQVFKKKEERHKLEIGIREQTGSFSYYDKQKTGRHYYIDYIFEPHIGYYPVYYWGFGISSEFNVRKSNIAEIDKKYAFGIYTRFYLPAKFSPKFFKRLDFFTELKFDAKNYYWPQKEILKELNNKDILINDVSVPVLSDKPNNFMFSLPLGIKYQIFGNLIFEFSPTYVYDFSAKTEYLDLRYGIDYYFLSNRKIEKKTKGKNNNFLNSFIVGNSVMYYNSGEYVQQNGVNYFFNFYLWNFNVTASINKSIFLGVQNFMFFTNNAEKEKRNYNLTGVFSQFDILRGKNNIRIFFDLSINNGNILFDFDKGPVYKKNTAYGGVGIGFDIPLKPVSEHIFLDLSGYRYFLLTNINLGFAFNQYVIGINYRFGKM